MPEQSNITPAGYSKKMAFTLDPTMPAHVALSTVLLFNLDIMEANEKGIKEDTDIEFLHDFRVANRRSRSLVTQVKRIYPEKDLRGFKKSFSWLSKLTGNHRDLDVFLADFPIYENKIPQNGGGELEPLRDLLLANRKREHGRLLRALDSDRYAEFKNAWRSFLEKDRSERQLAENGLAPVIAIASRTIWKNYNKLLKQGDRITTNYSFESIHKLRKDGKKLRYVLEAFGSLYPEDEVSRVIKNLKKLQNNLGDIVDMHMQQIMLGDWKRVMRDRTNVPENTIKAIEYLESLCMEEEKKTGEKFRKRFSRFADTSNRDLFRELFG